MTPSTARLVAATIVAVPLIGYPLVVGADGARFPSRADCVRLASPGETGDLDLVFGRRDTPAEAERLLERVQGVGYVDAEVRGVESIAAGGEPAQLAREAARSLGRVVSVTGAVDHVSDGERVLAVANGHELLGAVSGTGCMSTAMTGCFLAVRADEPLGAAAEALAAFGIAGEDAADGARGPGSFHVALYDALYGLDPATLDERARISSA